MAESIAAICNVALLNIGDTKGFIGDLEDPSDQAQACKLVYAPVRDKLLRLFAWPWATRRGYPAQLGGGPYLSTTSYNLGDYVAFAPNVANVVNAPETITKFVYLSLIANNLGNSPDSRPAAWRQISRAAWAYVFKLPGDLLKLNGIYHANNRNPRADEKIPYDIEYEPPPGPGAVLLTDAGLPSELWWGTGSVPVSIELDYTAQITDPAQYPPDFAEALSWGIAEKLALGLRKDKDEAKAAHAAYLEAVAEACSNALQEIQTDGQPIPSHISARR